MKSRGKIIPANSKGKAWNLAQKLVKELKAGFKNSEFYEVLCENVGQTVK